MIFNHIVNNKLFLSDEIYRIFNLKPQEFGATYEAFLNNIHEDDRKKVNAAYKDSLISKLPYKIEHRLLLKTGELKYVLEKCNTNFDKQGNPIRSIGTVLDITAQKKIELKIKNQNDEYSALNKEYKTQNEELLKAKGKAEESNHLKTEFLNNMSHEIRTPMNGILGFSQMLETPNISDNKRKQYVDIIKSSGQQLMHIIDDILEISQLGANQVKLVKKNICLNDLLLEQFSNFDVKAKENKIPLYLKKGLPDKESYILTDRAKLSKILNNLLENALKFTNEGFIEFGYQIANKNIEIYVRDTGVGVKLENQDTIFKKFSQEEKLLSKNIGGLGLGLSIAQENAELLGGNITLESEKGKGSTFFITIPYKPSDLYETEISLNNTDDKTVNNNGKYTILIVEDEEVNYLYLETMLVEVLQLNCQIIHAKHGQEAIEICEKNAKIDFVFMDLKMPIMNGFDATQEIKKNRHNLPIIAQTAYSTVADKNKSLLAGCDDFISKPINEEDLIEIINKYVIIN